MSKNAEERALVTEEMKAAIRSRIAERARRQRFQQVALAVPENSLPARRHLLDHPKERVLVILENHFRDCADRLNEADLMQMMGLRNAFARRLR